MENERTVPVGSQYSRECLQLRRGMIFARKSGLRASESVPSRIVAERLCMKGFVAMNSTESIYGCDMGMRGSLGLSHGDEGRSRLAFMNPRMLLQLSIIPKYHSQN